MTEDVQSFDRQKGESSKAFHAFSVYRDAGPDRSLRDTAKAIGKSLRMLAVWSKRWDWVARSDDYDRHLEAQRRRAQEKAILEMADRHAREAMLMQSLAIKKLQGLNLSNETAATITVFDAVRLMDVAIKAERLARGQTTENLGHSGEVKVVRFPAKAKTAEEWEEQAKEPEETK